MTIITFGFDDWAAAGVTPAAGQIQFAPAAPIIDQTTGRIVTVHPNTLRLDGTGYGIITLPATLAGQAVILTVYVSGFPSTGFYVSIPDTPTISLSALLAGHQVARDTLLPLPAAPTVADAIASAITANGVGIRFDTDGVPYLNA